MKKLIYIIAMISLSFHSCTSLEEEPRSFLTTDQFYRNSGDAIAAVDAIYFSLNNNLPVGQHQMYGSLFNTAMDMMTDDLTSGPGTPNPDVRSLAILTHSPTNIRVLQMWQQHYAAINRANVALDKIPDIPMDQTLKNRLLGEARFLRALFYFNVVRLYGDIPLVLTDQTILPLEELQIEKTSKEEVYDQIITDLTESVTLFANGSSGGSGRATEGAAKSLLAKVYLTLRVWDKAVETAEEVIHGSYGYDLFEDYSHVFLPAYKNGREHIFSAQFMSFAQGQGHASTRRAILSGVPGLVGSYGDQVTFYTEGDDEFFNIYKLYSPNDKRRDATFVRRFRSPSNGGLYGLPISNPAVPNDSTPFFNKYWDPDVTASTNQSAANTCILRFSEILLIHAEAENELNGPTSKAYASLNRVRERAGLDPLDPGYNTDQFREAVYLDRRLELVYEFQRYFDLIRQTGAEITGVGPEGRGTLLKNLRKAGKTNVAERHYLYPIPQLEIERNPKLKQNPLWENTGS